MIRVSSDSIGWIADARGKSLVIRTNLAADIVASLDPNKTYSIELREKKQKRSLDQNAMYWSILGQVAKAVGISNARCHNMMIRDYGQPLIVDGKYLAVRVKDTDDAEEQILESETEHLKPTSRIAVSEDGVKYRYYWIMRGSSTYNTAEMTRMIDGIKEEAKQLGITLIWEE